MGDSDPGHDSSPYGSEDETTSTIHTPRLGTDPPSEPHSSESASSNYASEKTTFYSKQNGSQQRESVEDDMADSASMYSEESVHSLPSEMSEDGWKEGPKPQSSVQPLYKRVADNSQVLGIKEEFGSGSDEEDDPDELDDEDVGDGEEEDELEDEEDMGEEEEEEEEEHGSEEEEPDKNTTQRVNDDVGTGGSIEKSTFGLYSGMSDILSGSPHSTASPSPSSRSSTPSLTPNKTTSVGLTRPNPVYNSSLLYKGGSGGGGLLVHHPVTPKKRVITKTKTDHLSEELNLGYRILMELMSDYQKGSNTPYMEAMELDPEKNKDYLEVVKKPLWLKKIKANLLDGQYKTITELIGDLRTMLENAYRYYGPVNSMSKKGLRLEHMMEQKIALLPKEIREACSLEKTSGQAPEDITQKHRNKTAKISVNGDNFFSYVLYRVRTCRGQRDKDLKKRRMEAMRQAKRDRELEVIQWEKDLLKEPLLSQMKAMWELPQIGHFIFLTLKTLNIYEVPQFELERMLLMPWASRTLTMLLTSLLSSPQQRQKLNEKPYMPYKVWARKLAHKTLLWYRCYTREHQNSQRVFDQLGIEPQFWNICGPTNPFERQPFHEMTYHQRVWLLKTLCDFLLHNHKTVQEVIADHSEADQREYHLGHDRDGNEYLHFPQFCGQDLRIYRRAQVPSPDISEEEEEECVQDSILPVEKVKEFKKMIKKFRSKYEEEAEWEGSRGKKRKRKKGRGTGREVNPEEEVVSVNRSRPGNLRQRPRARYKDQYEDLGLSSDEESPRPKVKGRKNRKAVVSSSSESEMDELKNGEDSNPPPAEGGSEEMASSSPVPPQQEPLTRAQQKNPRTRRGGKKKPTCELCGKAFQNIAALKGHRAVHTKERQKLASALEDISNQKKAGSDPVGDSSEGNGGSDNATVQNGECEPSEKDSSKDSPKDTPKDTPKDSSKKIDTKEEEVKNESLVNGKVKEEPKESTENQDMSDVHIKSENDAEVKTEALEIDIKKEQDCDAELKKEDCDAEVKKEDCDVEVKTEDLEGSEEDDSAVTKKLPPIYDPSEYLPKLKDFELVVTSVEQLRTLIQKFGDLPDNAGGSANTAKEGDDADAKKDKEESRPPGKRPSCEVKLHRALCHLLSELSPWETKLLAAQKRMRTKLRHEWNDYEKRPLDYVDPAEEAWASDPEPEPEPPPPPPPESSSSSSSSEESLDEDGNPKRKLRKRRAKRQAASLLMENTAPVPDITPVATQEETPDGYTVSSRGRVRKTRKMINYDGLDFEKLALQASMELEQERVRKRKRRAEEREEEERERESEEQNQMENLQREKSNATVQQAPLGVRRYLMSQSGHVMGYIDNEGQVHTGSAVKDAKNDKGMDLSSVRNLASQLVSKKEGATAVQSPATTFPNRTVQNTNLKPGVPTVVVAAINNQGSPVYVRVVGEQAMQLVKYMRPTTKGPVSQIKLQHHGQTYTVNTNAHMITHNIPGMPDGEATEKPNLTTTHAVKATCTPTSSVGQSRPGLQSLASSNSPSVPRVAPISSVVTSSQNPPNTLALAYRGVTRPSRPLTMTTQCRPSVVPGATTLKNSNHQPTMAATRLVSASPSVVSSVVPPITKTPTGLSQHFTPVGQQINRPAAPTILATPPRPSGPSVVNRIAVTSAVGANVQQPNTQVIVQQGQQQQTMAQTPAPVTLASSQTLGQAVTATSMAVPGTGGQVQLKLESESLAQLVQRTGSKIVALPNGRGGYTLSLTPGAVTPGQAGQKNQHTQIAASTAAKVQVVAGASSLLQDNVASPAPQQQQTHIISPQGVSRAVAVVHPSVTTVSRAGGVAQQQVVRQLVPASSLAKDVANTQVVASVGGQQAVYQRVGVQQRVYNQLVNTATTSASTVLATGQTLTSTGIAANQQVAGAIQHGVVQKPTAPGSTQTVNLQSTGASTAQQYVVQQRVVGGSSVVSGGTSGATTTLKPVVISQGVQGGGQQVVRVAHTPVIQQQQQQVVRLQNHSNPTSATQKLVQIVQPGGGRQVVHMVQQVVGTQAQATAGHQGLIYVQSSAGQVIQQKASLASVQQQQQQQVVVGQVPQQHIVQQQQVAGQGQPQLVQQQQILRQQSQTSHQVTQHQQIVGQQQPVVQQSQTVVQQQQGVVHQQQQGVVHQQQQGIVHQQQQNVVHQHQQSVVHQQQQGVVHQQSVVQQQQQSVVHQQSVVQQQGVVHQQQQQQSVVHQQQQGLVQQQQQSAVHQQQQNVVHQQQQNVVHQQQQNVVHQQQPVVHQQAVVQQQAQQATVQQQQQAQPQVQQGRLVVVRTNHGQQVGLQHSDGRVSLLTQEQLELAISNGIIKVNQQT